MIQTIQTTTDTVPIIMPFSVYEPLIIYWEDPLDIDELRVLFGYSLGLSMVSTVD